MIKEAESFLVLRGNGGHFLRKKECLPFFSARFHAVNREKFQAETPLEKKPALKNAGFLKDVSKNADH
ncbi:MAG: hypothetical protein LBB65_05130 [Burkholderiales bacterium]|nr:hypothetical protein [Burkholderiales bacterium]